MTPRWSGVTRTSRCSRPRSAPRWTAAGARRSCSARRGSARVASSRSSPPAPRRGGPACWPATATRRSRRFRSGRGSRRSGAGSTWPTRPSRARSRPAIGPSWRGCSPSSARRPRGGGDDHVRLLEAMTALVVHASTLGPLVLVIEDLHWADEASLRLFAFLALRVAVRPVLIVGTTRDDEPATSPQFRRVVEEHERRIGAVSLRLTPLTEDMTATLVQALAHGGRDRRAVRHLATRAWTLSEGNPFVVVEMVRAAADDPRAASVSHVPIPERVGALTRRRLGRLGEPARRLVAVAAVIGRDFDWALARLAAGLDEAGTAGALEELVLHRILSADGDRFDFTHDRVRRVVYADLIVPRRIVLHADVARAVEALHDDDARRARVRPRPSLGRGPRLAARRALPASSRPSGRDGVGPPGCGRVLRGSAGGARSKPRYRARRDRDRPPVRAPSLAERARRSGAPSARACRKRGRSRNARAIASGSAGRPPISPTVSMSWATTPARSPPAPVHSRSRTRRAPGPSRRSRTSISVRHTTSAANTPARPTTSVVGAKRWTRIPSTSPSARGRDRR